MLKKKILRISKLMVILFFIMGIASLVQAKEEEPERFSFDEEYHVGKYIFFNTGGYIGQNFLMNGYDNYKNSFSGGGELRVGMSKTGKWPKYYFRLNFDYMPLGLPKGVYGMTESIYALTFSAIYNSKSRQRVNFFFGPGIGYYRDVITLQTPASGYKEKSYEFFGLNLSVGLNFYLSKGWFLVPEFKFHMINEPGDFWATNLNFQLGVNYNFSRMEYKKWKKD